MDLEKLRSDEFIEAGRHSIVVSEFDGPDERRKAVITDLVSPSA
jgi:hypothetical protein